MGYYIEENWENSRFESSNSKIAKIKKIENFEFNTDA